MSRKRKEGKKKMTILASMEVVKAIEDRKKHKRETYDDVLRRTFRIKNNKGGINNGQNKR